MATRTITVRGVPDGVLRALKKAAAANRRSLNGELLDLLERAVARRAVPTVREAQVLPCQAGPTGAEQSLVDQVERDALAEVCRHHHIRTLAVFGSQVGGGARSDSDVDVLVEFEEGMTPGLGIVAVAEALRPVFGGRRVDLVTRRGLPPRLLDRILARAVLLHAD
jgi:uncharacterized protein